MTNKDDNQRTTADHTSRLLEDDMQTEQTQQNSSKIDDELNG